MLKTEMTTSDTLIGPPVISVIVPARNEEVAIGPCLRSLNTQAGVTFEIIVVDDHSTDRTREIAASFPGIQVIEADPLPPGWTGKNNAVACGAREAKGEWLLFTDADTVHLAGSLAAALNEAKEHGAALLSYSPQQLVKGFWENAVMPVIFAELAVQYRPSDVSDPRSPAAAANGQYIIVSREAYDAVGGHARVAADLLEDVALARAVKHSGRKIFFRYGADRVRTRMYRSFAALREGWTKNLALLFPAPGILALWRSVEFLLVSVCIASVVFAVLGADYRHAVLYAVVPLVTVMRIRRAHFSWKATLLSFFGLPFFSYLLLRSKRFHERGNVSWKGRSYPGQGHAAVAPATQEQDGLSHAQS